MDIEVFLTSSLGLGSLLVAFLVYSHSKVQQRDAWFKAYTAVYEAFWNDDEMRQIRSWIANDDAFASARSVLRLRKSLDDDPEANRQLTKEEYSYIDKLDRFFSLMTRMVAVGREFRRNEQIWGAGLWQFWLQACYTRGEFRWYMERYWVQLAVYCEETYGRECASPIVWIAQSSVRPSGEKDHESN